MQKIIDGKTYKQMKISKIIINGKEKSGSIISAEDTTENSDTTVTIFTEDNNKNNNKNNNE